MQLDSPAAHTDDTVFDLTLLGVATPEWREAWSTPLPQDLDDKARRPHIWSAFPIILYPRCIHLRLPGKGFAVDSDAVHIVRYFQNLPPPASGTDDPLGQSFDLLSLLFYFAMVSRCEALILAVHDSPISVLGVATRRRDAHDALTYPWCWWLISQLLRIIPEGMRTFQTAELKDSVQNIVDTYHDVLHKTYLPRGKSIPEPGGTHTWIEAPIPANIIWL